MADRRVVDIYWDVTQKRHRDSTGELLRQVDWPFVYFTEQPLLRVRLVTDSDLTPYTGLTNDEDYAFLAAIDDDFNHASTVLALSAADQINIQGDWAGDSSGDSSGAEGLAESEKGEFSIRIDCDTTEMDTAVASLSKLTSTWLEIQATDGSSSSASIPGILAIFQIPIIVRNKIYLGGGGSPTSVGSATAHGRKAIGSGVAQVSVTGLTLSSASYTLVVSILMPTATDLIMFATVRADTKTATGFTAYFSGVTDSANYILEYIIIVD